MLKLPLGTSSVNTTHCEVSINLINSADEIISVNVAENSTCSFLKKLACRLTVQKIHKYIVE